mmetsp:Transcript_10626/g.20586  ORF Transcript_10626/g.20586 Transcript_10626/m.20586 type:complete len:741 (+) Transcript_10626:19-2241(+)
MARWLLDAERYALLGMSLPGRDSEEGSRGPGFRCCLSGGLSIGALLLAVTVATSAEGLFRRGSGPLRWWPETILEGKVAAGREAGKSGRAHRPEASVHAHNSTVTTTKKEPLWCESHFHPRQLWLPDPTRKKVFVKVLTYNLWWWNLFGRRKGNNGSAGKLIADTCKPRPYDLMGFQECEDPQRVLRDGGLQEEYEAFQGFATLCMAYRRSTWKLLERGQSNVAEDMKGLFGKRAVQWMRLEHREGARLFFLNHHGPLPINTGGVCGGLATARNILQLISEHGQLGDGIVLVGDFNANVDSPTVQELRRYLLHVHTGEYLEGIDNIFSNVDRLQVVSTRTLKGGGSDHDALNVIMEVGRAPGHDKKSGTTRPPPRTTTDTTTTTTHTRAFSTTTSATQSHSHAMDRTETTHGASTSAPTTHPATSTTTKVEQSSTHPTSSTTAVAGTQSHGSTSSSSKSHSSSSRTTSTSRSTSSSTSTSVTRSSPSSRATTTSKLANPTTPTTTVPCTSMTQQSADPTDTTTVARTTTAPAWWAQLLPFGLFSQQPAKASTAPTTPVEASTAPTTPAPKAATPTRPPPKVWRSSTARPTAAPTGCDANCIPGQKLSTTCRASLKWYQHARFKGKSTACEQAHTLISRQCPGCTECSQDLACGGDVSACSGAEEGCQQKALTPQGKFAGLPHWVSQRRLPMVFTLGALVAAVSAISAAALSACVALSLVRFSRPHTPRGFRLLALNMGGR